jgi:ribose transport system substrate-binding protein
MVGPFTMTLLSDVSALKIFRSVACLAAAAILAGCGSKPQGGKGSSTIAKGGDTVAFVSNNPAEFWTICEAGAQAAAKEEGVTLVFKRPQDSSAASQKSIIEDLLAKGVKAISVSVISPENQTDFLNTVAKKVPLLCVDNDASKSNRLAYLGTANLQAGRAVGELVKEALPKGGKVAIFVGQMDPANAKERRQGVIDVLEGLAESKGLRDCPDNKKYGNYEVIGTYTDGTDQKKAKDNAADVLSKNTSSDDLAMVGLWAYNPPAILSAVKDSKRVGKVKIVGFDEQDVTLDGIREGSIVGTVVQQPYQFGFQSVKIMAKLAKDPGSFKAPSGGIIDVAHKVIKKNNVDEFQAELKKTLGK